MKIRTGDTIKVISGKRADKGKEAKVLKVFPGTERVLVEGVNIATRHIKKMGTTPGQIVKMEKPVHISSIALLCPYTKLPTRVGYVMVEEKGVTKKYRYSKAAVKKDSKDPKNCIIK